LFRSPFLLLSQRIDLRIICRAFYAAVPTIVVAVAIIVILSVGFVVLFIIAHQIIKRKSVVCRDKVDTGRRLTAIQLVKITASGKPVRQFSYLTFVCFPEFAYTVPVFTIPFCP